MSRLKKLDIIYEDKNLIVVNKVCKQLCIATDNNKNSLYREVSDYVKKQYPKNKVFIVNRLDKETSGIVLFAKKQEIKLDLQKNWDKLAVNREYLAIVSGKLEKKKDTLISYLKEDKNFKVYSSKDGKKAITQYEVLASNKSYSLLKVNIKTGRKNQIRVQLSDILHPIVGDKKYGSLKNPIGRMGLHASKLELNYLGKVRKFEAKIPKEFRIMFEEDLKKYEEA